LLTDHPEIRLYGEWMAPRSERAYEDGVWNDWFVFDVCVDSRRYRDRKNRIEDEGHFYVPFMKYRHLLDDYGIGYILPIAVLENPTTESLQDIADNHYTACIKKGLGCGEGIVVKRYDFVNVDGETVWGKVLSSALPDNRKVPMGPDKESAALEERIVHKVVTPLLIDKEYNRILSIKGEVPPSALMDAVWYRLITEHLYDEIRGKGPVIDFDKLRKATYAMLKESRPEMIPGRKRAGHFLLGFFLLLSSATLLAYRLDSFDAFFLLSVSCISSSRLLLSLLNEK
jgi:hypothetical protein